MLHDLVSSRLRRAHDFIDVATVVCEVGREYMGLHQCLVTLQATDGRPLLAVDDLQDFSDDLRLAFMTDMWRHDPMFAALCAHQTPVGDEAMSKPALMELSREFGYTGDDVHTLLLPLIQPGALLGAIRCGRREPFSDANRRDLTMVSSHVSVRLAQLGITTLADPVLTKLTPRQRDVATLAARGHTNAEIGLMLALSENTIKKHLKDIFDTLELANRTELASRLPTRPVASVPIGVTKRGRISITRTPYDASPNSRWPSASTHADP